MTVTVLEGSTFCICSDLGDIDEPTTGFFDADTRFLSRYVLTVDGERPLLLSYRKVGYFSAAFFLRNPMTGDLALDEISIARERFIGDAMQDQLVVTNHARRPVELELALELAADFADIFAVKAHDFWLGSPAHAEPLPEPVPPVFEEEHNQLVFATDGFPGSTQVTFSERGEVDGSTVRYRLALAPRERFELRVDVIPTPERIRLLPEVAKLRFGDERTRVADSLAAWELRLPQLRTSWEQLARAFDQAVSDLASLRMREHETGGGKLFAAGAPWFMAVFGRDTIVTSLQTFLLGPELARNALSALAELQAEEDDPELDAEPGKIVHEVRRGKGAEAWFPRYYGTVDATPLYLILLSELWRWTDDLTLAQDLQGPALAALRWIDRHGDLDGDGLVEYRKRSSRGLDNQSWKDSGDSQLFADGTPAEPPIASCEVQGYVYDAKLRAAEMAREVWRDRELADRLEREAAALRDRFDEAFWCEERGGYYALALDAGKRRVDSLCSNVGHLLWSGIVPPERVDAVVDQLMGPELWSGWGVRTMSTGDAGFNPLAYHNGTVWPHDNSLIALGLARHGRWAEAQRIVQAMLEVAESYGYQLPEVFAGFSPTEAPFPVPYPTATRPQAWAAGAVVLLLQVLLGLRPDRRLHLLESAAPLELPSWAGSLSLSAVPAFGRTWDVRLEGGRVEIEGA